MKIMIVKISLSISTVEAKQLSDVLQIFFHKDKSRAETQALRDKYPLTWDNYIALQNISITQNFHHELDKIK